LEGELVPWHKVEHYDRKARDTQRITRKDRSVVDFTASCCSHTR